MLYIELGLVVENQVIYSEMTLKHSVIDFKLHSRRPAILLLMHSLYQENQNNHQKPSKFSKSLQLTSDEAASVEEAT